MEKIRVVLTILNNYIIIVAFFICAMALLGVDYMHWGSLCLFVVIPFAFYFVRCKLHKFWIFLCMHAMAAGVWYAYMRLVQHSFAEIVVYSIVLIYYIIFSFYLKGNTDDGIELAIHPGIMMGGLVVGFWGLNQTGNTAYNFTMLILLVVQIGFYFAQHYIDNYISFIKVNQISVKRFHGKKIFKLGIMLSSGYIILCAAILMLFTNPQIGKTLVFGFKKILFNILNFIFSLIKDEKVEIEPIVEEEIDNSIILPDMGEVAEEQGLLVQIFGILVEITFCLIFVAVIIAVVVWIVRLIQGLFKSKRKSVIIEGEASIQDITEQLEKEDDRRKKNSIFYGLSINARIRKVYYKYVMGNKKEIEESTHKQVSSSTAREVIRESAVYYEKARYSTEEVTTAELKSIKKDCQNHMNK